jgi:hypothetical protein
MVRQTSTWVARPILLLIPCARTRPVFGGYNWRVEALFPAGGSSNFVCLTQPARATSNSRDGMGSLDTENRMKKKKAHFIPCVMQNRGNDFQQAFQLCARSAEFPIVEVNDRRCVFGSPYTHC